MTASPKLPSPEQFAAADRIYQRAIQWQRIDRALHLLREEVRGFGPAGTLLKAVAINALYSTNVYAIVRVAEHLASVLARACLDAAGADLVEELANVPMGGGEKQPRRRHSFASKFAHFFIDPERFPILDRFAEETVKRLLGSKVIRDRVRPYVAFAVNFDHVSLDLKVERDLDVPEEVAAPEGATVADERAPRTRGEWRAAREGCLAVVSGRDACAKIVVSGERSPDEIAPLLDDVERRAPDLPVFLQPATPIGGSTAPKAETLALLVEMARDRDLSVRVVPQVHRALGVP